MSLRSDFAHDVDDCAVHPFDGGHAAFAEIGSVGFAAADAFDLGLQVADVNERQGRTLLSSLRSALRRIKSLIYNFIQLN